MGVKFNAEQYVDMFYARGGGDSVAGYAEKLTGLSTEQLSEVVGILMFTLGMDLETIRDNTKQLLIIFVAGADAAARLRERIH